MPTGYTADVQSGKVTEFSAFAMQCARAFGALITMRDDPPDASIPEEFAPSSYNAKRLEEARQELARLIAMTADERQAAADAAHTKAVASWDRYEAERVAQRERYEAMLTKVDAWQPPTPDHGEMKKFMQQQLSESIRFDCSGRSSPRPEPKSADEWYAAAVSQSSRDVEYHTKEHAKEVERAINRTEWVRALRQSLAA